MNNRKVFIGVSGGIDSAASLVMLKERGFDVTGVYLFMLGETVEEKVKMQLEDLTSKTGVEIIIHDVRERFREYIVEPFIKNYFAGETPSPCADCNPLIKWHALVEIADRFGGGLVATGHYCRVEQHHGHYYLTKGADRLKDQSYYMWQLPQSILSRAYFPLGEMTKQEVREFMCERGFEVMTTKRESMGVCFLEGKKYTDWLMENGVERMKGAVMDEEENVVGEHNGYPFYTLAQKKGFQLYDDRKGLAVTAIDCKRNTLTVGDSHTLISNVLYLKKWCVAPVDPTDRLQVKVRGVGVNPKGYCNIEQEEEFLKVTLLDDTAWAVTKGQPAVFYMNDRLIGGGIVERWLNTI